MITVMQKCDLCGFEQNKIAKDARQMWEIEITVRHHECRSPSTIKSVDWCRNCVEKYGLLPNRTEGVKVKTPEPSFEDMVREIVREEVAQA